MKPANVREAIPFQDIEILTTGQISMVLNDDVVAQWCGLKIHPHLTALDALQVFSVEQAGHCLVFKKRTHSEPLSPMALTEKLIALPEVSCGDIRFTGWLQFGASRISGCGFEALGEHFSTPIVLQDNANHVIGSSFWQSVTHQHYRAISQIDRKDDRNCPLNVVFHPDDKRRKTISRRGFGGL